MSENLFFDIKQNIKEKNIKAYISVNSVEVENNNNSFVRINNSISKNEIQNKSISENKYSEEEMILLEVDELNFEWALKIPKISLLARIEEGTNADVLDRSIGHFEETEKKIGNIGLAAHNRGYKVNYFSRLKELSKGDMLYYIIDNKVKKYSVSEILIIYETDWTMLENTEDNRLTLITCVENRENYRLCVQAKEVEI